MPLVKRWRRGSPRRRADRLALRFVLGLAECPGLGDPEGTAVRDPAESHADSRGSGPRVSQEAPGWQVADR